MTLDRSSQIKTTDVPVIFGPKVSGFVNSSKGNTGDETRGAVRCLNDIRAGQFLPVTSNSNNPVVFDALGTSAQGPLMLQSPSVPGAKINPWRYNSSNPTNNPNSYDLWVDVLIAGKTNRISNWTKETIVVSKP